MTKSGPLPDIMDLAKRLMAVPSTTGDEAAVADVLAGELARLGFRVVEQTVEGPRRNILALGGPEPRVILCSHLDTVPPFIPPWEDEDYLYGRGACDTKGIQAVMIRAAAELEPERKSRCGLLFLVGEETDSVGADRANDLGLRPDYTVVGEPTENKLGLGHKGFISLRLTARGRKAHSGYPHLGESAVLKLMDALDPLRKMEFDADPVLGETTLNIGRVEGGVAANVVPDGAWALISIRTTRPSGEVLDKVRASVADRAAIEVLDTTEPQELFALPGFETAVLSYSTDIPHLRVFGRPLLFGPGSILDAHTDGERISKAQMREAVGLYRKLVAALLDLGGCGGGRP